jgi:hypothetical protein
VVVVVVDVMAEKERSHWYIRPGSCVARRSEIWMCLDIASTYS